MRTQGGTRSTNGRNPGRAASRTAHAGHRAWCALALALVGVLALAACGGTHGAAQGTPGFRVGLVTDVGKIDDRSFNQSVWEGVQQAQGEVPGITEAKYVETTDPKDYEKNIQQFTDANYDVVVTVGFALADPTYEAAKRHPNIRFIGVEQVLARDDQHPDWPLPNLVGITFEDDKAGFLAGALAALTTRSGTVGAVLATDTVPPVYRFGEGFRAGVRYANPSAQLVVAYHNDVGLDRTFTDPEWGKTTANAEIDRGADVLFGAGGKTGNGALIGIVERGKWAIGVDTDQYYTMPEAQKGLLSSAMKLLQPAVVQLVRAAKEGTFPAGTFTGEVALAPFHDLDSQVSADVKGRLAEIQRGLTDGSIKTAVAAVKPAS
ncbi:MAG TPA: BMP family ABC transporter substrate-binding protein [Chloroflexota bacterium]|nr:BMP family ABC transporter substrate-binding protein [Chloroflexota bacterium]